MCRPVLLILLMIHVWSGAAQEGAVRLSLDDALERFAACNLSLIAERYNMDMAEAQVVQAKLFENPVISLEQNIYNVSIRRNTHCTPSALIVVLRSQ